MGAVAVSKAVETQTIKLQKALNIPSKAGVIRAALKALERQTEREKLRREVQESVRCCADADRAENRELFGAGIAARGSEG